MDMDMCRLLPLKRKLDSENVSSRVEIEAMAPPKTLNSQNKSIQDLYSELEEERFSAATAASEAMSMILRLQREKAESQMEFRQFKMLAEEKLSHDQEEILALEDLLFGKAEEILAYGQHFGFGFSLSEPQTPVTAQAAGTDIDYSSLRCKVRSGNCVDNECVGETPREWVSNIEQRICQIERTPSSAHEKGVIVFSPYKEIFCVVDKVPCRPESCTSTPRDVWKKEVEEEIKRLNVRLQVLEVDREMTRQTTVSMGTDKVQHMLLKEIAQQLCKEVTPKKQMQKKKVVWKTWFFSNFSIGSAMKWITSFVFWWKKSKRTRYTFGITINNVGLLLLFDQPPWIREMQCLTRTSR